MISMLTSRESTQEQGQSQGDASDKGTKLTEAQKNQEQRDQALRAQQEEARYHSATRAQTFNLQAVGVDTGSQPYQLNSLKGLRTPTLGADSAKDSKAMPREAVLDAVRAHVEKQNALAQARDAAAVISGHVAGLGTHDVDPATLTLINAKIQLDARIAEAQNTPLQVVRLEDGTEVLLGKDPREPSNMRKEIRAANNDREKPKGLASERRSTETAFSA